VNVISASYGNVAELSAITTTGDIDIFCRAAAPFGAPTM
jgi:hypothetical protein